MKNILFVFKIISNKKLLNEMCWILLSLLYVADKPDDNNFEDVEKR